MFSLHIDSGRSWGGGQNQVMFTVTGLRALGHRAMLAADPEGELYRRMSEGLDLIPLAPASDVDLAAAWRLSRLLKKIRPEVLHAHDSHAVSVAATALSIAAPEPRPPLLASRRAEFRVDRNSFSRWKYSQVDTFIANSGAIRDRLVADGVPRAKIAVITEGVDVDRIAHMRPVDVHADFYLPHGAPVVGNVAALVPHKGQHHLVDAAALVVREVPDVRFVIAGDGEQRASLEKHIKDKHLEHHVFLAGFRADALEITKGLDLFVLSSVTEGRCTALMEAMVDGQTGYLVAPRDHRAMADRIVVLLKNERLRAQMGAAAQARARERFTVERMVEETLAVYEQLAGTHRAAGIASHAARG